MSYLPGLRIRPFRISQIIFTILINSYLLVFFEKGLIYTGYLKSFLVPILNCWSTPTAWFSCPLGAYQHFIVVKDFPFYVLGFFFLIGAIIGRMACGWLCPFGLFQDLIFKINKKKISLPKITPLFTIIFFLLFYFLIWLKFNNLLLSLKIIIIFIGAIIGFLLDIFLKPRIRNFDLTSLKYFFLLFLTTFIVFFTNEPWFCKLCPQGTLAAGIPLVLYDPENSLKNMVGLFFYLKILILILLFILGIYIKRVFCRTICPIGAIYSFFNKVSCLHLEIDKENCIRCNICRKVCPTNINIYENPNQNDCLRCLECYYKCPQKLIKIRFL